MLRLVFVVLSAPRGRRVENFAIFYVFHGEKQLVVSFLEDFDLFLPAVNFSFDYGPLTCFLRGLERLSRHPIDGHPGLVQFVRDNSDTKPADEPDQQEVAIDDQDLG